MVKVKMTNHHPQIFSAPDDPEPPKFPLDDKTESELIDDDDDCIICGKLLLDHTEEDANECFATLVKKQRIIKKLSQKNLEVI